MNAAVRKHLVRYVLYPSFFSLCFALMIFWSFPYGALKDRIVSAARTKGMDIGIESLRPTFLGVKASGVELNVFKASDGKTDGESIRIDSLEILPSALPMGVYVRAKLLGGQLDVFLDNSAARKLKVRAKSLQLSRLPPSALGNLIMDGEISLLADLSTEDPKFEDFAKTDGRIAILADALLLSKGTIQGFPVPRVDLGKLELDMELSGGKARLRTARTTGVDLVTAIEGDIKQARKVSMSTANLVLRLQPEETFLKRNKMISTALGMAMSKDSEGGYSAQLKGTLNSLKFSPQKGGRR